jgi:hypothetical protein
LALEKAPGESTGSVFLVLDAFVNFFPVDGDIPRCIDAYPDLVTFDTEYGYGHFITDH